MNDILKEIKQYHDKNEIDVNLKNNKLFTHIKCYSTICKAKLNEFSECFNKLFEKNYNTQNVLNVTIIENNILFEKTNILFYDAPSKETNAIKKFNAATITTSQAKCTKDDRFYILKCYDYFIYIFDKKQHECYMIIKNNIKAITMVNILLLTPYLMYGELYAVHGGLVSNGTYNILINNSSLGGKTTFALLFASNNWNIITEETTYITKNGNVLPYNIRNYFNIRVGTYLTFKDYFIKKGILNNEFLKMENKTNEELFDYGKKNQFSIDFDKIGKNIKFTKMKITHSIKVSIEKRKDIQIKKCSPTENVNAFLELSLAPTVLLFQELLNYNEINKEKRQEELNNIFKNTKSFILKSNFNYKENFDYIVKNIEC